MNMYKLIRKIALCLLVGVIGLPLSLRAQFLADVVDVSGYVKELGGISFDNRWDRVHYDNFLQSRLESTWSISDHLEGKLDVRNRLLSGYTVRNRPGYLQYIDRDPGFADLSWTPLDGDNHIWHVHIDRLNLTYFKGPFEVRVGRHRLNWSRTFVWSPNDLFNNFAYLDFDYEERPGTDAISAQYSWGYASGLEIAYQPAETFQQSVIAGMIRESYGSYDLQFIGGYYRDQWTAGAGFSGYLGGAGLKGEISYFHPSGAPLEDTGTVSAAMGVDYMFPSKLYMRSELLYNGGWSASRNPLGQLTRPPQANDLFIARSAGFVEGSYPIHPLVDLSLGAMISFDRPIYVFMPSIDISATKNIDVMLLSQLYKGRILRTATQTPNYIYGRIRWSF